MSKDHILARLTALNSQLEAEARQVRDATMWRKVASMSISDLADIVDGCDSMAEFVGAITEQ